MSTTAAPTLRGRLRMPSVDDRRGTAIVTALLLIGLVSISLLIRTQAISSPFWIDEGLSVGIASHPFSDIFHALRGAGASSSRRATPTPTSTHTTAVTGIR